MKVRATKDFTTNMNGLVIQVPAGEILEGTVAEFCFDNDGPVEKVKDDTVPTLSQHSLVEASAPQTGHANPAVPEEGDGQEPAYSYTGPAVLPEGKDSGTDEDDSPAVDRRPPGLGTGDDRVMPAASPAKPARKTAAPRKRAVAKR